MASLYWLGCSVYLLGNSAIYGAEDLEGLCPAEASASDDSVPVDLRRHALQNPLHSRPGYIPCLPRRLVRLPGAQVHALGCQEGCQERVGEVEEQQFDVTSRV